ncbi:GntR family transcriptional regulator [Pseudomonas fontis]|uniref:GntR family transcriptional regulator n=1 Tax=Pseudomonas fontis TaxID=2942633 RepID=A0ABT5NV41_9PSED|nr:GntR family transcriptional regulator [Pseudomonas fontis]MDD0973887.1 GntR family transcriptional regulator [Pseudomonas fontis]MDD0992001.1 GntR family transcriptional regulator [Pseudomonas fontis]
MDAMTLHIEPAAADPIYRQIVGQISRLITAGQCPPGTRLPSVREVAAAHAINPMTVSKAYNLLEAQGLLERQPGKGMRVASRSVDDNPLAARLHALQPALLELARQARQLDLEADQVIDALLPLINEAPSQEETH